MILDFSFSMLNNAVLKSKVVSCTYRLSIFGAVYSASFDVWESQLNFPGNLGAVGTLLVLCVLLTLGTLLCISRRFSPESVQLINNSFISNREVR